MITGIAKLVRNFKILIKKRARLSALTLFFCQKIMQSLQGICDLPLRVG